MTEPTDDELDAVIAEYRAGIYPQDMHPRFERAIMRAAIAKWGQPAHSGEPVAWQSRTRPTWGGNDRPWSPWESCTRGQAEDYWKTPLLHDWAYEARALYTAPQPSPAAQGDALDAARLDWLDQQCEGYGFQDIHEGNRWEISGPYANVRVAIDAERAARKQGANHD